ncbi:hypothetical protein NQ318_001260 [Aromia moschata]|uniref:Maturase K n=1 Tax=Aromia moschata TaxID=1265417 RepID=A0AAV8ZFZ7_9CUCU|nr:hypothetical protein NQ318_001260 [Aromia moschata]
MWAGIVANRIRGPFFFEETLTGVGYLEFLQNDLVYHQFHSFKYGPRCFISDFERSHHSKNIYICEVWYAIERTKSDKI